MTIPRRMSITRQGGFAGMTVHATIEDELTLTAFTEVLAALPLTRQRPRGRDMFVYVFRYEHGTPHLGRGAMAERHLSEHDITPDLRTLLNTLKFQP